ncbi:hypothetical protein QBC36DRAFT_294636 [Triangularia setosa]|uniref:Uncharacterized protein n=1 Tax=Triangularia setosa TaxID=2587417 RepID=A0AAN6VYR3_9PEZI|nr:hypothetical protein QBC36DRAFT_294636 [Podospora setosa]
MRPMVPVSMVMPMVGYSMGAPPVSMPTSIQSLVWTTTVSPSAGIPIQIILYNPAGTIVGPVGPVQAPMNGYAPPMRREFSFNIVDILASHSMVESD